VASYTTPRTANVGDIFTAAWYNAEIRDDIKWAHDTLISVGSSFPASPLTGQRHMFVSGKTRRRRVIRDRDLGRVEVRELGRRAVGVGDRGAAAASREDERRRRHDHLPR
jgi:hypothetical protein